MERAPQLIDLPALPSLTRLYLSRLPWKDLSPLAGLKSLQSLRMGYLDEVTDISTLAGLPDLSELLFGGHHSLTELGPLLELKSLRRLNKSLQMNGQILQGRRDPVLTELAARGIAIDQR